MFESLFKILLLISPLIIVAKPIQSGTSPVPSLPRRFDMRNISGRTYLPPIRDQLQNSCGACVAFATIAALEGSVLRKYPTVKPSSLDFSEGALFFCGGNRTCSGEKDGWELDNAIKFLDSNGVYYENQYPFRIQQSCVNRHQLSKQREAPYRFKSKRITTAKDLKRWVFEKGPVIVPFMIREDLPPVNSTRKMVALYMDNPKSKEIYGHAAVIVGWNDDNQSWLIRNSYGARWNGDGYIWMRWGAAYLPSPAIMHVNGFGFDVIRKK